MNIVVIKSFFNSEKINYEERTITQASKLKEKIEKLKLKKKDVTLAKLDIVGMYPLIQFLIVKKSVRFFSKDLSSDQKNKIETCLEMIGFGMKTHTCKFYRQIS